MVVGTAANTTVTITPTAAYGSHTVTGTAGNVTVTLNAGQTVLLSPCGDRSG